MIGLIRSFLIHFFTRKILRSDGENGFKVTFPAIINSILME